ncbi:hypothetical protein FCULG_00011258 [Fusarium culmorum]|uniref:Uncharacterized protein n=1 Tax=Fusarium culmorum TaxID=5516 RepID=A0A2T4H5Q7_FUSCU|nr:hypothetical protein FCULG_00011258 [Fusarium culmorum]
MDVLIATRRNIPVKFDVVRHLLCEFEAEYHRNPLNLDPSTMACGFCPALVVSVVIVLIEKTKKHVSFTAESESKTRATHLMACILEPRKTQWLNPQIHPIPAPDSGVYESYRSHCLCAPFEPFGRDFR